jgi:hypothetical protein
VVSLRGQGAPETAREVTVARGSQCEIDFTQADPQAQATPPPPPPSSNAGEGE